MPPKCYCYCHCYFCHFVYNILGYITLAVPSHIAYIIQICPQYMHVLSHCHKYFALAAFSILFLSMLIAKRIICYRNFKLYTHICIYVMFMPIGYCDTMRCILNFLAVSVYYIYVNNYLTVC